MREVLYEICRYVIQYKIDNVFYRTGRYGYPVSPISIPCYLSLVICLTSRDNQSIKPATSFYATRIGTYHIDVYTTEDYR